MPTIPAPRHLVITDDDSLLRFNRARWYSLYLHYRRQDTRTGHYQADVGALTAAILRLAAETLTVEAANKLNLAIQAAYRNGTLPQLNSDLSTAVPDTGLVCVYTPTGNGLTDADLQAVEDFAEYLRTRGDTDGNGEASPP